MVIYPVREGLPEVPGI